jgi:hypothetical protein
MGVYSILLWFFFVTFFCQLFHGEESLFFHGGVGIFFFFFFLWIEILIRKGHAYFIEHYPIIISIFVLNSCIVCKFIGDCVFFILEGFVRYPDC